MNRIYRKLGAIHDITELVEAQRQLNSSEEMLRSMIQQSPVAIDLFETEALIIKSANPAMLSIVGKNETVIGMELEKVLPELTEQDIIRVFKQVLKSGQPYDSNDIPVFLRGNSGLENRYFNIICTPIHGADNEITGIMVMSSDFTWQHHAQIEIKAGESKFRNLIEQSPVGCSLMVGRELIIEFTNEAMIKIWGKGHSVVGEKLIDALPELMGQPYIQILENVYDSGQPYHSQSARADLKMSGIMSTFYFDIIYTPLFDVEKKVYGILQMAIEVTARVEAQMELERSEKLYRELAGQLETRVQLRTTELNHVNGQLISSNQSLEQFANAASHDLQKPLRKVVSFGSRLESRHRDQLDDEGKFLLSRMQDAANRMSSMISRFADFFQIRS